MEDPWEATTLMACGARPGAAAILAAAVHWEKGIKPLHAGTICTSFTLKALPQVSMASKTTALAALLLLLALGAVHAIGRHKQV